jgi:alcohol dehydrogenase class IV
MNQQLTEKYFTLPENFNLSISEMNFPRRVIAGYGASKLISSEVKKFGSSALIITHAPGRFTSRGILSEILADLKGDGVRYEIITYQEIATTDEIDQAAAIVALKDFSVVLCIGGGTILDAGKAISLVAANPGSCEDYMFGRIQPMGEGLPIIAVPTTAGSGSESTTVSVIRNKKLGLIKSLNHIYMLPKCVILDPNFIKHLNPEMLAVSGLDAFSHALESYTSPKSSSLSRSFSISALEMIYRTLPKVTGGIANNDDYSDLLVGAHLAGIALNAGVGAAHIFAQPLTATIGISHGQALSAVLEEVVSFNEEGPTLPYKAIVDILDPMHTFELRNMSAIVKSFMSNIGMNKRLKEYADIDNLSKVMSNIGETTSHIWTNARPISNLDIENILHRSWL